MARVRKEPSNERGQRNLDFYEAACINNTRLPKKTYTGRKLNIALTVRSAKACDSSRSVASKDK